MRAFVAILCLTLAVVFSTPCAAGKFPNKDTARNRQDNSFGTRQTDEVTTITENATDGLRIDSVPRKQPERDWYENMVIGVDVGVNATDRRPKPKP
ncbi:hypothetical protein M7784_15660 [Desulfovibrio aminophilus]|nr:hypothetical protein [Desulfovibrio aminophilus]MCM0756671.1 hypothetical protein [Desulfovibrio aminophilus]